MPYLVVSIFTSAFSDSTPWKNQYTIAGFTSLDRASGSYLVKLDDTPYLCTLTSVWGGTGTQTITFSGYGTPDKGGNIVLTSGTMTKTIVVDSYSGEARLQ